jgi:hypothetical protein
LEADITSDEASREDRSEMSIETNTILVEAVMVGLLMQRESKKRRSTGKEDRTLHASYWASVGKSS